MKLSITASTLGLLLSSTSSRLTNAQSLLRDGSSGKGEKREGLMHAKEKNLSGLNPKNKFHHKRRASLIETIDWNQLGSDIESTRGWSVAISSDGNVIAIGASYGDDPWKAEPGLVRVYSWNGAGWYQVGSDILGESPADNFGFSIDLSSDGKTVAIGARFNDGNGMWSGHVRVHKFNGTAWNQVGADIDGEAASDQSGCAVSISSDGSTVAIGAKYNGGNGRHSGHVRVYNFNSTTWNQVGADIDGEAAGDQSGTAVSISSDGNTVAIGAPNNNGNSPASSYSSQMGHVRVYSWNTTDWNQVGTDINGENSYENFGRTVNLSSDGETVAVGGEDYHDTSLVRVFKWDGNDWAQAGSDFDGLVNQHANSASGQVALSSDGLSIVIGVREEVGSHTDDYAYDDYYYDDYGYQYDDYGYDDGTSQSFDYIRVYQWDGTSNWNQLGSDIFGDTGGYYSEASSVALSADGRTVVIGTPGSSTHDIAAFTRVLRYAEIQPTTNSPSQSPIIPPSWTQVGGTLTGEAIGFGSDVSLSSDGNTVAVSGTTGYVRVYRREQGNVWTQVGADITGKTCCAELPAFRTALSHDGNTLAIGSMYKGVLVYNWSGTSWSQVGSKIGDDAETDSSGGSLSLSSDGRTVAVGAPYDTLPGQVRVYQWDDETSNWLQLGTDINGEVDEERFGWSVSLSSDGRTVAVGAPFVQDYYYSYDDGYASYDDYVDDNYDDNLLKPPGNAHARNNFLTRSGYVRVYKLDDTQTTWSKVGYDMEGLESLEHFGMAVSISADGQTVAVGSPFKPFCGGGIYGDAAVYKWNGSYWSAQVFDAEDEDDEFGMSISLSSDGNLVAIGAPGNDWGGTDSGQVRVYEWDGASWHKVGADLVGLSLSLSPDGSTIAIGSPNNDSGNVRIFSLTSPYSTSPFRSPSVSPSSSPSASPSTPPTLAPTSAPLVSVCGHSAQKIKISANTEEVIQVFEVKVLSEGTNVALGKNARQSSTFRNNDVRFGANRALDGDLGSFSHTDDSQSWWEVDLGATIDIDAIDIMNRWCKNPMDEKQCLCRLSDASVSLLDSQDNILATMSTNDTCGKSEVAIDFSSSCSSGGDTPSESPVSHSICSPRARKVKIAASTEEVIQVFEVQVLSQDVNVALGKNASQSSTYRNNVRFGANRAIDGDIDSFSHTDDSQSWWEVDLGAMIDIDAIDITNRWCKDSMDEKRCLCRLSNASVSMLDEENNTVASMSTNNTCGNSQVHIDPTYHCSNTAPTKSPSTSSCLPHAKKVKLHQTTSQLPIQIFELLVISSGTNIAEGKASTQSSTFVTASGKSFDSSNAFDGDMTTFSHTNDSNPWLEVDLNEPQPISSVKIQNRWCQNSGDPKRCLCRLTGATLSLIDVSGEEISSILIGNTCGESMLEYAFGLSSENCPSLSSLSVSHPSEQPIRQPWHERIMRKRPTQC